MNRTSTELERNCHTRRNAIDSHVSISVLLCRTLGEADDRILTGRVEAHGRHSHLACDAGSIDLSKSVSLDMRSHIRLVASD